MKFARSAALGGFVCLSLFTPFAADAQTPLSSIGAPDKAETSFGALDYKDGVPSAATIDKLYDNVDLMHGVEVYLNAFAGVSTYAARQGLLSIGVEDNQVLIFPRLMDAKSIFLTANADAVYFISNVDLTEGPMVVEAPPESLGTIDDMWFNWVIDFGTPGPDRGAGGKYLILPPGYDGSAPEGGFYVARSKTSRALVLGRAFLVDNDPKPTVDLIQKSFNIYPYIPGGSGTSIAEILSGEVKPGREVAPPAMRFVDGSNKAFNTVPPSDFGFFEMLNALVQHRSRSTRSATSSGWGKWLRSASSKASHSPPTTE